MIAILTSKVRPNLYMRGPAAGGKNTLLYVLAGLANYPVYLMSLHYHTRKTHLVAMPTFGENGKDETGYRDSPLLQAADPEQNPEGAIGALDEVNKPATPGVLAATYSLLQNRFIVRPDSSMLIAARKSRFVAMGNPDRPPYIVSPVPVDFERRFQFIEMDYLHAPKRSYETDAQEKARIAELKFILYLHGRTLYEMPNGTTFVENLIGLAQDIVQTFEEGALPRPMTMRGLIRLVRHFSAHPEDLQNFYSVFKEAYNTSRLDPHQKAKLETLIQTRLGADMTNEAAPEKLAAGVAEKDGKKYFVVQVKDTKASLVVYPLPDKPDDVLPVDKLVPTQSVLRAKVKLFRNWMAGEHTIVYGHTGTGKTSLFLDFFNNDLKIKPYHMQLDAQTMVSELWGKQEMVKGQTTWMKTPLILAMEEGKPLIIDDIGKPEDQAIVSILNNVLQHGTLETPYGLIRARPGFFVAATTTMEEARYAAHELSGEVEDRFFRRDRDSRRTTSVPNQRKCALEDAFIWPPGRRICA
jgi:MoxR-like ATPase